MPRKTTANAAKDELLAEFQALVADTEKLLQSTADVAGEQAEKSAARSTTASSALATPCATPRTR